MRFVVALALCAAVLLARANQDFFAADNLSNNLLKVALIAKGNMRLLQLTHMCANLFIM